MIRVRCILVETTVPVRIRPRMETRPVKGHFLSVGYFVSAGPQNPRYAFLASAFGVVPMCRSASLFANPSYRSLRKRTAALVCKSHIPM